MQRPINTFSGTRDYKLHGSQDQENWQPIGSGRLALPWDMGCFVPLVAVDVKNLTYRYIQFTAVNYYGEAAALMFLGTDNGGDNCECNFYPYNFVLLLEPRFFLFIFVIDYLQEK